MHNPIKNISVLFILLLSSNLAVAQDEYERIEEMMINGVIVRAIISNGDTMYFADFDSLTVSSIRFESRAYERHYLRMKLNADKVYPYAEKAIELFRKLQDDTEDMRNRERRRYIRDLQKDVKTDFEDPLKSLTKTQGKILIKMVERELEIPVYDVLKDVRGTLTAFYWQNLGNFYGYDLREGYNPQDDIMLEYVLRDLFD